MIRRGIAFVLVCAALTLVCPLTSQAQTEAELRSQLEALKRQTRRAGDAFTAAHWKLDETEVRIARTDERIRATSRALRRAKRRLNQRAEAMYRRDEIGFLGMLLGASDYESFVTRLDYVSRVGAADARALAEVKTYHARLMAGRSRLVAERRQRAAAVKRLRRDRDRLLSRLRNKEAEFRRVKTRLDRIRSGGVIPRGVSAIAGPNGMVFPVVGSYYYADTWGASRSGGRRRHQGTDIMAPRGTPVVAILPGRVTARVNGLGGRVIWLLADNGWLFYYAHLDRWVVRSGRVRAGQVIGTVGSTGNASGGAPHLHLQVHPGGGSPVNPYPYLRDME